jgi:hypothetical protein
MVQTVLLIKKLYRLISTFFIIFLRGKILLPYNIQYHKNSFLVSILSEWKHSKTIHPFNLGFFLHIIILCIHWPCKWFLTIWWLRQYFVHTVETQLKTNLLLPQFLALCRFWRTLYLLYNREFMLLAFTDANREWRHTVVWLYLSFSPFLCTCTVHLSSFIWLPH